MAKKDATIEKKSQPAKSEPKLKEIEIKAKARYSHISCRKMRPLFSVLKKLSVEQALLQLEFIPRRSSGVLVKLINSAVANAVNNHNLQKSDLIVKNLIANQGPTFKRHKPAAFGVAHGIKRPTSHIEVVLSAQVKDDKGQETKKEVKEKESVI